MPRAKEIVGFDDLIELESVGEQRSRIETLRLHHRHQSPHSLLSPWAKSRHDFVVADAGGKRIVRHLKFAGINAKATQRAAWPERTQTILKCFLKAEGFYGYVSSAAGEALLLRRPRRIVLDRARHRRPCVSTFSFELDHFRHR